MGSDQLMRCPIHQLDAVFVFTLRKKSKLATGVVRAPDLGKDVNVASCDKVLSHDPQYQFGVTVLAYSLVIRRLLQQYRELADGTLARRQIRRVGD